MKNILNFIQGHKKKFSVLFIALFLGTYLVSYGVLVTSDAYKVAREFVYNSKEFQDKFGVIQEVKIVPGIKMGGMTRKPGGTRVHYYLHVFAAPNDHMVHVKLEKIDGAWFISRYEILY